MLKNKKLFMFDIDGTLVLGYNWLEGAKELLEKINADPTKDFVFITNNSTKSIADYIHKFQTMGIEIRQEQVMTAGLATCYYLKEHQSDKKIFVLGTESFIGELKRFGLTITEEEEEAECLLVAYDSELTYKKLVQACHILKKETIPFFATNTDLVCPDEKGFIPDCGAICEMLFHATKRKPLYIGKPYTYMIDILLNSNHVAKDDCLIVGDRMYTDILCGINSNIETAIVFTGETTEKTITAFEYKPTFMFNSAKNILEKL